MESTTQIASTEPPDIPSEGSPQSEPKAPPERWPSFAISCLLLCMFAGLFVLGWYRITAPPKSRLDPYFPTHNGVSARFRIINPDGSVSYQSTNIQCPRAEELAAQLDATSFGVLMRRIGVDVNQFDTQATLQLLRELKVVQITDIEEKEADVQSTPTTLMLFPDHAEVFRVGQFTFDPLLPILPDLSMIGSERSGKGVVNNTLPYEYHVRVEARESVDSAAGKFSDCVRVRSELMIAQKLTTVSWYCRGLGTVRSEVSGTSIGGTKRLELIGYSLASSVLAPASNRVIGLSASAAINEPAPEFGGKAWEHKDKSSNSGIMTPVVSAPGQLLFGTYDGALVALDRSNRRLRWRLQTGGAIHSAPVIADATVYVTSSDKHLYAANVNDGAFLWAFLAQDVLSGAPALAEGLLVFGSEDWNVYALDPMSGKEKWHYETGGPIATDTAVEGPLVFVGSDDGAVYALNAVSGEMQWMYATGNRVTASPVVSKAVVYAASRDGNLYALKADSKKKEGEVIWTYPSRDELEITPVVTDTLVILAVDTELRAVDIESGTEKWRRDIGGRTLSRPVWSHGRLIVHVDRKLLVLDTDGGRVLKVIATSDSALSGALSVDGGLILVPHFDGTLEAFGGPS